MQPVRRRWALRPRLPAVVLVASVTVAKVRHDALRSDETLSSPDYLEKQVDSAASDETTIELEISDFISPVSAVSNMGSKGFSPLAIEI